MSAGLFEIKKYKAPAGQIVRVKVQPETAAAVLNGAANAEVGDDPTVPGIFNLNLGGRRRRPFSARYVTLAWTGSPPTGYTANATVRIPVLNPTVFAGCNEGDDATYLGAACQIVGKSPHMGAWMA